MLDALLSRLAPKGRKTHDLEADLYGADRNGPRAEVEFEGWASGQYRLEIEVKDRDGHLSRYPQLDVAVGDIMLGSIPVNPAGRTYFSRTHEDGPLGFEPAVGQIVMLGSGGVAFLSGQFQRD